MADNPKKAACRNRAPRNREPEMAARHNKVRAHTSYRPAEGTKRRDRPVTAAGKRTGHSARASCLTAAHKGHTDRRHRVPTGNKRDKRAPGRERDNRPDNTPAPADNRSCFGGHMGPEPKEADRRDCSRGWVPRKDPCRRGDNCFRDIRAALYCCPEQDRETYTAIDRAGRGRNCHTPNHYFHDGLPSQTSLF